jgi:hypothetical protein
VYPARQPSRPVFAAVAATAVAAVTIACGSSATTNHAGTGFAAKPASAAPTGAPLAGQSAGQIFNAAVANTDAASSVRMRGASTQAGQAITFDLTLARGEGCEGTLAMSKTETFQVVYLDKTVWMKPSAAFYTSLGTGKASVSALGGKYIKATATNSLTGNISQLCTLSGLLSAIGSLPANRYAGASATFSRQPAIKITQPGRPEYAYVSDTAKPVILQLSEPGSSGATLTFSDYNVPVTITSPPAAQTVDGSQFGL